MDFHCSSSDSVVSVRLKEKAGPPPPISLDAMRAAHFTSMSERRSSGSFARYVVKPAASNIFTGSEARSLRSVSAVARQRSCSPPSWPMSPSALSSVSPAMLRLRFNLSASAVRDANSSFSVPTRSSISLSSSSHVCRRRWDFSNCITCSSSSASSGSIFSTTSE
jgi:hypothetical protein